MSVDSERMRGKTEKLQELRKRKSESMEKNKIAKTPPEMRKVMSGRVLDQVAGEIRKHEE